MTLVPLSLGSWLVGRLRQWSGPAVSTEEDVSLLVVWWLGLALATAILEAWALAGPLRGASFAVVGGLAGVLPFLDRPSWRRAAGGIRWQLAHWPWLAWVVTAIVALLLLLLSALAVTGGDTAAYHAPMIRWYEEMGVVPGLANLDVHLGYNSSWAVSQVLSSWAQWLGSPLQSLTSLALLLFTAYSLAPLAQRFGRPVPAQALFRLLLGAFALFWLGGSVIGLGSDPGATLLGFTLITQAIALDVPGRGRPLTVSHVAVGLLALYAITIKLSVVPLVLLPVVWLLCAALSWRAKMGLLLRLAGFGAVLVLPWVLTTSVLTGYLLFPFPALDVLPVDWKFPQAVLYEHMDYIRNFARNPALSQYNVYGQPLRYWLPVWWQQQQFYDKFITLAAPVLALATAVWLGLSQAWRRPQAAAWALAFAVLLLGSAFWFLAAPAYRFGYTFLLPLFCLLLVPLLGVAARLVRLNPLPLLAGLLVAMLLAVTVLVELSTYGVPRRFTPSEFAQVLAEVPAGGSHDVIAECYQPDKTGGYALRLFLPGSTKLKLVRALVLNGQLQKDGLMGTRTRLLRPTPYPALPFDTFKVGKVNFLRVPPNNPHDFFYAPFPVTNTFNLRLRTGELRDGFLPYRTPAPSDTLAGLSGSRAVNN